MKYYRTLWLVAALTIVTSSFSNGQTRIGVHLGELFNEDLSEFFVGANGWFSVGELSGNQLVVNPHLEIYFIENVTRLDFNGNLVVEFGEGNTVLPFAGAGIVLAYASISASTQFGTFSGSDTEAGLNLTGGAHFDVGSTQLLGQAIVSIGEDTFFKLIAGIDFEL